VDAWLFQQPRLINARAKTVLPVLAQRQALADHLIRLLDRLPVMAEDAPSTAQAVIYIPDNNRDRHLAAGRTTNGQPPVPRSPESQSPTPRVTVELPSRRRDFISPNGASPTTEPTTTVPTVIAGAPDAPPVRAPKRVRTAQ